MARIARLVLPGIPHHVTQRGNRREVAVATGSDLSSKLSPQFPPAEAEERYYAMLDDIQAAA